MASDYLRAVVWYFLEPVGFVMDEWKRIAWLVAGIVLGAGWAYAASWHWLHDVDTRDELERATAQVSYR